MPQIRLLQYPLYGLWSTGPALNNSYFTIHSAHAQYFIYYIKEDFEGLKVYNRLPFGMAYHDNRYLSKIGFYGLARGLA